MRGWRWAQFILLHADTDPHAQELKNNTLNHTVSLPTTSSEIERHLAEWGQGPRVQKPLSWDKAAVWVQVVVGAVFFLPREKVQRQSQGPRPQAGRPHSQRLAAGRPGPGSFPVLPEGPARQAVDDSSWGAWELRCRCAWLGVVGKPHPGVLGTWSQSWASSERHLRVWSLCASGRIWLRIPPRRLDVASVARMRGFTTVGGSWRITPPTAPVSPFCS